VEEPIVEIKNVSFSYPPLEVLEDVNLTVKKGEFLAIIGPNGGGKTTLLKIILGLLKPQKGEVYVAGKRIGELRKWRSKIGYVPQAAQIDYTFPITVEEFVMTGRFGLIGLGKRPRPSDWEMVQKALKEVKMEEWSKKQIGELSGGQRQKILIARSLASEPEILILDEPTTAVDLESSESFYELLLRLHKEEITIITVSHDV
jgi:zinc transport system ATP-binding protein